VFESETFVLLTPGFSIHDGDTPHDAALGRSREPGARWGRDNIVYYFVSDSLEDDFARVAKATTIRHPIKALPHGELTFRCLDPGGHEGLADPRLLPVGLVDSVRLLHHGTP
jgi:hypothetical protein